MRKFIVFSLYHSAKYATPPGQPPSAAFFLFVCLFVFFLRLLAHLFANLHGTHPRGGMGRGPRGVQRKIASVR